jgi:hypothetical protein
MRVSLIVMLVSIVSGSGFVAADTGGSETDSSGTKPAFREHPNEAFIAGERLVFDLSYGVVKAGEGEMRIPEVIHIGGREVYRVQLTARSVSPFSWVYRVEDLWETHIDKQGIFPWKFSERIREGGYRRNSDVAFDHTNNRAVTKDGEYPIPAYTHDMVSAFYYVRTLDFSDLEPGDRITVQNFHRDSTYSLDVIFHGREEVRVKTGTFNTIIIEPLIREGGLFKHEGAIHIWLTDDNLRIPVRMRTRIPIGSITAELSRYSGLRDAIRARVQ